jgi:hypothetical protein
MPNTEAHLYALDRATARDTGAPALAPTRAPEAAHEDESIDALFSDGYLKQSRTTQEETHGHDD